MFLPYSTYFLVASLGVQLTIAASERLALQIRVEVAINTMKCSLRAAEPQNLITRSQRRSTVRDARATAGKSPYAPVTQRDKA